MKKAVPGKIRIKDKVYFEYHELEKPLPSYESGCHLEYHKLKLKEYKASKKLIEVSNEHIVDNIYPNSVYIYIENRLRKAKNNQPCKAKITENTCTIIELL